MRYAFIPDIKRDDYPVPIAINVQNEARSGSTIFKNYTYGKIPNLRFFGSNDISSDTRQYLLTTLYKWYVSNERYDPVVSDGIDEIEIGSRYPRWPYDYVNKN